MPTLPSLEPAKFRYDCAPSSSTDAASVVLLPGLFAGEWIWDPTTARLQAEAFGVIRLLDPFASVDEAGSIADLRTGLRDVLDELSVERCTLAGNSLGGLVALDFARHYPDRVHSVVVSGAPGLEPDINLGVRVPRRGVTREFLERLVQALFYDPGCVTEEMYERTTALLAEPRSFGNVTRALRAARSYPLHDVLTDIRAPVLLVWGQNDRVTPAAYWEPWARLLSGFELRTIPQCGHSPMVERPEVFNELIVEFLRRQWER